MVMGYAVFQYIKHRNPFVALRMPSILVFEEDKLQAITLPNQLAQIGV